MGAAAGHISHLYEDESLTFEELFSIFDKINTGSIAAFEKVDGQNLMITVKDRKILAARNKGQIKNPVELTQILTMFDKYPHVRESFDDAFKLIWPAFNLIGNNKLFDIFRNGTRFLNIEIVNKKSKNVIDYNDPKVIFNNLCTVNTQTGNIIEHNVDDAYSFYNDFLNIFQERNIYPPLIIDTPDSDNFDLYLNAVKNAGKFNLNQTIGEYCSLYSKPALEQLITKMGTILLMGVTSHISNVKETFSDVETRFNSALDLLKQQPELETKMKPHIDKIQYSGGLKRFTPIEGIVFYYKTQPYKITGLFAPINQILGIFKYSR